MTERQIVIAIAIIAGFFGAWLHAAMTHWLQGLAISRLVREVKKERDSRVNPLDPDLH